MIITRLAPICILLTVQIVVSANTIGDTFLEFKDDHIHGIYLYGTDIIGVLLNEAVYVGKINDRDARNITEVVRIPREGFILANYTGTFLEFKLIDNSSAFWCISHGCCVNSLNVPVSCSGMKYDLESASAALTTTGIMLHTANADSGSIQYLLRDKMYVPDQESVDTDTLSEFVTVAGFSTDTHSYFIGSAIHLDLTMQKYNGLARKIADVRITRVCKNDKTPNLASRIDLVLSCEGIDYNTVHDSVTNRATAALYLSESSELLVAFQHGLNFAERRALYEKSSKDSTHENYICRYNFTELQLRFTKAMDDNQFDNCELHTSNSTSNAYSSIANFKPYEGILVFGEYHQAPFVAIRQLPNEEALYALRNDNNLIRVRENLNSYEILTSIRAKPGEDFLQVLPNSNKLLFVPTHSNNTINVVESSCKGIYKTCQSIAWNDPLNCIYCANEDGSGIVVSDKVSCPNNATYQYVCPPVIIEAKETVNDTYLITGIDLDKFLEDLEVTVCDSRCNLISAVKPTSIRCFTGTESTDPCIVKVKGSVESIDSTFVNVTLSKQLQNSNKTTNSKWKKVIFIFALVGLFVIICICFWQQYGTILKRKYNHAFNQTPLVMLYNPVEES